jgi:prepilin-type N-terminal cleavage/methylation domain-containing protein
MRAPAGRRPRAGFTLAEVAVTLIIVGITLLWVLEGLNRAKMTAAHTHNSKIAAELGQMTLAEIESGLYWEEIDEGGIEGNYAEEGYEAFYFEVVLGDDTFSEQSEEEDDSASATFLERQREEQEENDEDTEDEEEESEEPYERVKVRVSFPKTTEERPELILERWIPWEQVYGPLDEEAEGISQ